MSLLGPVLDPYLALAVLRGCAQGSGVVGREASRLVLGPWATLAGFAYACCVFLLTRAYALSWGQLAVILAHLRTGLKKAAICGNIRYMCGYIHCVRQYSLYSQCAA